jgi:hypothetical protein
MASDPKWLGAKFDAHTDAEFYMRGGGVAKGILVYSDDVAIFDSACR